MADADPKVPPANASFLLASRNTSLALQRTRMAADRTLMAVIRTSLSLISFGFTIFKVAQNLVKENVLQLTGEAIPHFGVGLVLLGLTGVVIGVWMVLLDLGGVAISGRVVLLDLRMALMKAVGVVRETAGTMNAAPAATAEGIVRQSGGTSGHPR